MTKLELCRYRICRKNVDYCGSMGQCEYLGKRIPFETDGEISGRKEECLFHKKERRLEDQAGLAL